MPFVHLANGDVLDLSEKEWQAAQDESGTPNAVHRDGKGSHVIGVYPSDYEYEQTDDEKNEDQERREFEQWKRDRDTNAANTTPDNGETETREDDPLAPGEPVTIERDE